MKTFENNILNEGLNIAMEFGENWLNPIQERLSKKYPKLDEEDLDYLNIYCREAMFEGHQFIPQILDDANKPILSDQLSELFSDFIRNKYNWINKENINRLFSQGCYYAWKDGYL